MTTDWLVNSNFGRICRIFGTAVDSANSNFGWSSLGKPADDGDSAPAGVAEGAPLSPARTRSGRAVLKVLRTSSSSAALAASAAALISAKRAAFCSSHCSLLGLGGVRSLRPHCGSRGWGRDCRPRVAPRVAHRGVCGQCERPVCAARKIVCLLDFLAREDRPNATR